MKKAIVLLFLFHFANESSAQRIMFHLLNGDSLYGDFKDFKPKHPCGQDDLSAVISSSCNLSALKMVIVTADKSEKLIGFNELKDFWSEGSKYAVMNGGAKVYPVIVDGRFPLYEWNFSVTFRHKRYDNAASYNTPYDVYAKSENVTHGGMEIFFIPKYKVPCNVGYFKKKYAEIMSDCPAVIEKINKGEIDKEDMVAAFEFYNKECGKK